MKKNMSKNKLTKRWQIMFLKQGVSNSDMVHYCEATRLFCGGPPLLNHIIRRLLPFKCLHCMGGGQGQIGQIHPPPEAKPKGTEGKKRNEEDNNDEDNNDVTNTTKTSQQRPHPP